MQPENTTITHMALLILGLGLNLSCATVNPVSPPRSDSSIGLAEAKSGCYQLQKEISDRGEGSTRRAMLWMISGIIAGATAAVSNALAIDDPDRPKTIAAASSAGAAALFGVLYTLEGSNEAAADSADQALTAAISSANGTELSALGSSPGLTKTSHDLYAACSLVRKGFIEARKHNRLTASEKIHEIARDSIRRELANKTIKEEAAKISDISVNLPQFQAIKVSGVADRLQQDAATVEDTVAIAKYLYDVTNTSSASADQKRAADRALLHLNNIKSFTRQINEP